GARTSTEASLQQPGIYPAIMQFILARSWLVLLLFMPLLVLGYFAYAGMPSDVMPQFDEGGFVIDYDTPPGTSLAETDRLLRQVEAIIRANPDVQSYCRRTGFAMGGDFAEPNSGDFFVRLKPFPRRDIEDVESE